MPSRSPPEEPESILEFSPVERDLAIVRERAARSGASSEHVALATGIVLALAAGPARLDER